MDGVHAVLSMRPPGGVRLRARSEETAAHMADGAPCGRARGSADRASARAPGLGGILAGIPPDRVANQRDGDVGGPTLLCAVDDGFSPATLVCGHAACIGGRSVFPVRRQQRRKPCRLARVSNPGRTDALASAAGATMGCRVRPRGGARGSLRSTCRSPSRRAAPIRNPLERNGSARSIGCGGSR